ncbi:SpoIIE family protein phosphatase [Streptomyces sp. A3M-1-3]|uniref:SpoIIE family protein phosphatase n=1 Tax=Streptomyces sp. A3M-1-3 TaxID=2962044 RepID=UPI0020B6926C|nr:SpoIIE family protein phosphatase [Streptomyces sp. A3M-1-3]MCP3820674.1 SpoIIE family protein phosphatase [Streptomyces sp. A3M-1-3]
MIMPELGPPPGPADEEGDLRAAVAELSAEVTALHAERARRHLLDLAAGVLVAQLSVTPFDAADHLIRLAESTGLSAEDFAADIVNAAAGLVVAEAAGEHEVAHARRSRRTTAAAESGDTVGEVAAALLEGGLRPLGAQALWLWRRTATDCLELAGHAGASAPEASHWQWIPPESGGPLHRALAGAEPGWLPAGPPSAERLPGPAPDAGRAIVPLWHRGTVTGLALAVWPGPADLDEPVRRALVGLTETAARMLDEAGSDPAEPPVLGALLDLLAHPAMMLRTDPETSALYVEHLNPAAMKAAGGIHAPTGRPLAQVFPHVDGDLVRLVVRVRSTAAPQRAGRIPGSYRHGGPDPMLDVRVLPAGRGHTVVLWHATSDAGLSVARALGRLEYVASFEDDLITGDSRWSDQAYTIFGIPRDTDPIPLRKLGPRLHAADTGRLDELLTTVTGRLEGTHTLVRAIRDDGGLRHVRIAAEPLLTDGVLTGVTGIYQDVSARHHTEVALSATFDQLTAVQAQSALRHQLALQLQQAIVPEVPRLEESPGLQVAARYRPAAEEYRVGGDWYDVLPLPSGRVLVAVGDIAGHGIDASTGMVALRNALRGLAFTGHSPGRLMTWLNEVTLHTHGRPTATAVCALYDPADRSLCWASAGHLPLLLLREGKAELLEPPRNILLGAVPSACYQETVTQLMPGDTLLLYTDGFIERRHTGLDESLAILRRAAERLGPGGMDEHADRLMGAVIGDTDDDTSLVVVRVS